MQQRANHAFTTASLVNFTMAVVSPVQAPAQNVLPVLSNALLGRMDVRSEQNLAHIAKQCVEAMVIEQQPHEVAATAVAWSQRWMASWIVQ